MPALSLRGIGRWRGCMQSGHVMRDSTLLTVGQRSWKIRFEAVLFSQGSEGHGREARVEWANGREAEVAGGYGGAAAAKGEGEMG